jgi:hypothetical protein
MLRTECGHVVITPASRDNLSGGHRICEPAQNCATIGTSAAQAECILATMGSRPGIGVRSERSSVSRETAAGGVVKIPRDSVLGGTQLWVTTW